MTDPSLDVAAMFGARMEVGLQLRAEVSDAELSRERARVRAQVKNCSNCLLRGQCTEPVPLSGPKDGGKAKVLVVGEAPGKVEDQKGVPFVGPSGKLMRAMMTGAGFDLDTVAWCNTVSCLPNREPPTPGQKEMVACRNNLRDQVVASGATYVVLAGGIATSAWRSDLKVSDVHGQVFLWGQMWVVMPVFHPAAILLDRSKKTPTLRDLTAYASIVHRDGGLAALALKCIKCSEKVEHYDVDGVPYCQRHWLRYGNSWKKEWERWSNDKAPVVSKRTRGGGKKKLTLLDGQGTLPVI